MEEAGGRKQGVGREGERGMAEVSRPCLLLGGGAGWGVMSVSDAHCLCQAHVKVVMVSLPIST